MEDGSETVTRGMGTARAALGAGLVWMLWGVSIEGPPLAQTKLRLEATAFEQVIGAINAGDWSSATPLIDAPGDTPTQLYLRWRELRAGLGDWSDYLHFLETHADWPGLPLLKRMGEHRIPEGRPPAEILAYFKDTRPSTGLGTLRLDAALRELERTAEADRILVETWRSTALSAAEEIAILRDHAALLEPHLAARIDALIWQGKLDAAERHAGALLDDHAALARLRIALRRSKPKISPLLDAVPEELRAKSAGLRYDRFHWRMRRDLYDGAEEMLAEASTSRAALGRPEAWAYRRGLLARRAMRQGRIDAAYALASQHFLEADEKHFHDLEWLAGYIALEYQRDAPRALQHFERLRAVASTPISSGRAEYWLGRAYEAVGDVDKALAAFAQGARHQTSFYGQLAAARAGLPGDPALTGRSESNWQEAAFTQSSVFRTGLLLHHAGARYDAGRFFAHLSEELPPEDQARLGAFLIGLGEPNMAVRMGKSIARTGRAEVAPYYPLIPLPETISQVPTALVLAVIRQESEFRPEAQSHAGAKGLMQLMPATARAVATANGTPHEPGQLIDDPVHNVTLGTAYLDRLLERYDGSLVLTVAAYNAGPGRVSEWIETSGDPRDDAIDPVRWIEEIPYTETRNYVQRVLEGVGVYRARLTGDANAVWIESDLRHGITLPDM